MEAKNHLATWSTSCSVYAQSTVCFPDTPTAFQKPYSIHTVSGRPTASLLSGILLTLTLYPVSCVC